MTEKLLKTICKYAIPICDEVDDEPVGAPIKYEDS